MVHITRPQNILFAASTLQEMHHSASFNHHLSATHSINTSFYFVTLLPTLKETLCQYLLPTQTIKQKQSITTIPTNFITIIYQAKALTSHPSKNKTKQKTPKRKKKKREKESIRSNVDT